MLLQMKNDEPIPNVLAYIGGGLGDKICAVPALEYAVKRFEGLIRFSVLCDTPDVFNHLKVHEIFITGKEPHPDFSKYTVRGTYAILKPGDENTEPVCPFSTSAVDYCSIQLLKWQIPFKDREIHLVGTAPKKDPAYSVDPAVAMEKNAVILHPGIAGKSGWASKDIPEKWWEEVVDCIARLGGMPVIIGQDSHVNGVAKLRHPAVVDLTNKLTFKETIYLLQRCKVIITNDSMPIHAAASCEPGGGGGEAWIGMLATARHPDFLMHWRKGKLAWRMKNHSLGGVWSKPGIVTDAKSCEPEDMKKWMPQPGVVARWAVLAGRGELED